MKCSGFWNIKFKDLYRAYVSLKGSGQSQTTSKISSGEAKAIASSYIGEEGAYVSSVSDDGSQYICYISDADGNVVDAIAISYSGENLGRA